MEFISGNSEDQNGKNIAKIWKNYTNEILGSPYSGVAIYNNGSRLVDGLALFTEYTGSNIEIHLIGKGILNRTTIKYLANYVFNDLNCNVLRVKLHSRTQEYIQKYLIRLGFEYETVLDEYYAIDDDAIIYKMNKDKAKKWINLNAS